MGLKKMLLFFLCVIMLFATMLIFFTMTVFHNADDVSFDDTEVTYEETSEVAEEATEDLAEKKEEMAQLDQFPEKEGAMFSGVKDANQFIREYFEVSGRKLEADVDHSSDTSLKVSDGRCEMEITDFNSDSTGDFQLEIIFDDFFLQDEDIEEVFRNCLMVMGVTLNDAEEITDGFSMEENRYHYDNDIIEENYDYLHIEFISNEISYKPRKETIPGRIIIQSDIYPEKQ